MHSVHSGDSNMPVDTICQVAIAKGLKGVTITDHVNIMRYNKGEDYTRHILDSYADVTVAKEKYKGLLEIRHGFELGEYNINPEIAQDFIDIPDTDQILCSLHALEFLDYRCSLTTMFEDGNFKVENLDALLDKYYDTLVEIAKVIDADIFAHLTYPVRYTTRYFGINTLPERIYERIFEILKIAVERGIAIEVNTASIGRDHNDFVPDERVLREYKRLGGKLVTIGCDAHKENQIGHALNEAANILKSLGFTHYYYYDKRKPIAVKI